VCPPDDEVPGLSGIGVALVGATDNVIAANRISGNLPSRDTAFSGGVTVVEHAAGQCREAQRDPAQRPGLLCDETGTGNVFKHNVCRTSTPAAQCESPTSSFGRGTDWARGVRQAVLRTASAFEVHLAGTWSAHQRDADPPRPRCRATGSAPVHHVARRS
jgi:hypothetical protein